MTLKTILAYAVGLFIGLFLGISSVKSTREYPRVQTFEDGTVVFYWSDNTKEAVCLEGFLCED